MLVLLVKYCCFIVINVSELCSAISGVPFPLNASDSFADSHSYQPLIDRPMSSVKWSGGNNASTQKRETTATKGLRLDTLLHVA